MRRKIARVKDDDAHRMIAGTTAADIADSVRTLVDRGSLTPGDSLPSVRALAEELGVNRNTVVSAYRHLAHAGIAVSAGRGGTRIATTTRIAQEGFAADTILRDLGTGNPDPSLIPDITPALATLAGRPVLYGEAVIDPDLAAWATAWMTPDVPADMRITITGGAVDAMERLLTASLTRDDAVGLEDPCFLSSMRTVRLGGYRPVPVAMDEQGMTVAGLRNALDQGVRAVVCTPRAQNPTGISLTETRATELRAVLAEHPHVLIIEDDHHSLLADGPYRSLIGPHHQRWALVRSVSKFLGPDMCLAVAATDPETAARLATRLSPGTVWVSHLLQRLVVALVRDPDVMKAVDAAGRHYRERNAAFTARLTAIGLSVAGHDGLNLWVRLPVRSRQVAELLMRRGWLARPGDEFVLGDSDAEHHLRLTVHDLIDDEADRLTTDLAAAVSAAADTTKAG